MAGGGFRENANLQVMLPAPHPNVFSLVNTLGIVLMPAVDVYWMPWSQNYTILVNGIIWETFIYQEQLSRSTTLHPLNQHNLLNDDLHDFPMDEDDEEDEDEDEDEGEGEDF